MNDSIIEKPGHNGSEWVIAIVMVVMMLFCTAKCHAADPVKVDTMVCKTECIKQIVQKPSVNGKSVKYDPSEFDLTVESRDVKASELGASEEKDAVPDGFEDGSFTKDDVTG